MERNKNDADFPTNIVIFKNNIERFQWKLSWFGKIWAKELNIESYYDVETVFEGTSKKLIDLPVKKSNGYVPHV